MLLRSQQRHLVALSVSLLACLLASSSSSSHVWAFQPPSLAGQLTSSHRQQRAHSTASNARQLSVGGAAAGAAAQLRYPTSLLLMRIPTLTSNALTARSSSSSSTATCMASTVDQENITSSSSSAVTDVPLYGPTTSSSSNNMSLTSVEENQQLHDTQQPSPPSIPPLLQKIIDKVGKIDESRIISTPEYLNGEEPKLFSNLQYETTTTIELLPQQQHSQLHQQQQQEQSTATTKTVIITKAKPAETNLLSSSALLCGTALGCGLLNLPTAIYPAGYLPTLVATLVAWAYMTITALLTSELLINRYGETGRVRNVGLLELYDSYLGGDGSTDNNNGGLFSGLGGKLASLGFLIVSYIVMGVYLSEGGDQLMKIMDLSMNNAAVSSPASVVAGSIVSQDVVATMAPFSFFANDDGNAWITRALFATVMGVFLSTAAKFNIVQRAMTNILVPTTLLAFLGAMIIGLPTADIGSLTALKNQHPEVVLDAFPLLFMSWTYHGVVPRVVYDLEGDKNKITLAIVVGEYEKYKMGMMKSCISHLSFHGFSICLTLPLFRS